MAESGRDRLAARTDSWVDRQAGSLADHPKRTVGKWVALLVAVIVGIGALTGVVGWLGGWWSAGKNITSAQNVQKQSYNIRQDWANTLSALGNACQADQQAKSNSNDPTFVEDPALAYAATYRNLRANYNREQENPFENGILHIGGYPTHIKVFPEEYKKVPNWCIVLKKVNALHG